MLDFPCFIKFALAQYHKYKSMEDYWVIDDSSEGFEQGIPYEKWLEASCYVDPCDWDSEGFGEMTEETLRLALSDSTFCSFIQNTWGSHALQLLHERSQLPCYITYGEVVEILSNKRRHSYDVAVHQHDGEVSSATNFVLGLSHERSFCSKSLRFIGCQFLANPYDVANLVAQQLYHMPLFILTMACAQVALFGYNCYAEGLPNVNGPVPVESWLIYRPDRKIELWRFVSYALEHSGLIHFTFNLSIQLFLGIPMEIVYGSARVGFLYLSGVIAGSVASSIADSESSLIGAAGGAFSLLTAYVLNCYINFFYQKRTLVKVMVIIVFASFDLAFSIWTRYTDFFGTDTAISYVAHLGGTAAGLSVGLVVLQNIEENLCDRWTFWLVLLVLILFVTAGITWNVVFNLQEPAFGNE